MTEIEYVSDVGCELIQVAASDDMVAMAAWVSNDQDSRERLSQPDRVEKLINFLYRNKHMSPFEHGVFTFKVDVPLFVAREFHRHRTASYNEVSGRYTEMKPRFWMGEETRVQQGKMGNYYFVPGTDVQTDDYRSSKKAGVEETWAIYQNRLDSGIAKEQAREDLPLSLMTQFYVTMNPRNLMQFLTLRNESTALKEIQMIAVKMEEIFAQHMPLTHKAFTAARDEQTSAANDKERVKELELEIKVLKDEAILRERSFEHLKKARAASLNAMNKAQTELAEALKIRDDALTKYNALYIDTQEKAAIEEAEKRQWEVFPDDFQGSQNGSVSLSEALGMGVRSGDVDLVQKLNALIDRIEKLEHKTIGLGVVA